MRYVILLCLLVTGCGNAVSGSGSVAGAAATPIEVNAVIEADLGNYLLGCLTGIKFGCKKAKCLEEGGKSCQDTVDEIKSKLEVGNVN